MDSDLNIINRLPQKSKTEYFFNAIPDDGLVFYLSLFCNNTIAALSYTTTKSIKFTVLAEGTISFVGIIDFCFIIKIKDMEIKIKQIMDSSKPSSFIAVIPGFGKRYFSDLNNE